MNIAIFSISLPQFDIINFLFFVFSLYSHIIIEIENIFISIIHLYVFSKNFHISCPFFQFFNLFL